MQICVYTTNHPLWLHHMRDHCSPDDLVCFRSNRKWATAKRHLDRDGTLPVLIRETKDDTDGFMCTFVAELTEIWFPQQFTTDKARRNWLNEKLWLQREGIQSRGHDPRFESWQDQFKAWEIDNFMKAKTFYIIRNLRAIEPLPLPNLTKVDGGQPLSADYTRGYSICYYPESKIKVVAENAE